MKIKYITLICVLLSQFMMAQLTQAEYFWDTDPGVGSATALQAVDGAIDETIEDLFKNGVVVPATGTHTFNVRVKDNQGVWGPVFKQVFQNDAVVMSTQVTIAQAEYFWDTDPGEGSATALLALDGNLDQVIEDLFQSGVVVPAIGTHTFNVRIKDSQGGWGPVFKSVFRNDAVVTSTQITIVEAEYFWNTDPGEGSGQTILAVDGNLDHAIEDLFKDGVPLVLEGLNVFNIRIKDSNDTWGPVFKWVISVEVSLAVEEDSLLQQSTVLYPNPATDVVNLKIDNNYFGEATVEIYDITGKLVLKTQFEKNDTVVNAPIQISNFAKGMYVVKLTINNKQTVKRLIK